MRILAAIVLLVFIGSGCASKKAVESSSNTDAKSPDTATKSPSNNATAKSQTTSSQGMVSCTMGKEVRTLEIRAVEPKGCELIYTKGGEPKSVASSVVGTDHCQSISARIQNNLESAGYKCQ